jgi:PelA/Pel-15E family pectate lyase
MDVPPVSLPTMTMSDPITSVRDARRCHDHGRDARATSWYTLLLLCIGLSLGAADRTGVQLLKEDDAWLRSAAGAAQLANLLTFQTAAGGWCKAFDARAPRAAGGGADSYGDWQGTPTIDNGATWSEVRVLGRAFTLTQDGRYRDACLRGIAFLLERQYDNGGWPQRSPRDPGKHAYGVHITFNDHAMAEVLTLMRDVAEARAPWFAWMADAQRQAARSAFTRGIACVLRAQIVTDGKPTGWCQQHDATTLAPTSARAYELPCVAGAESARIALLLMTIDQPDEATRRAVDGAVQWFTAVAITGKKIVDLDGDRVLVDATDAPRLWARCYDLATGQPFFCDRDGIKRTALSELSQERRTGYAWYGTWGEQVLREHARWLQRNTAKPIP